MTFLIGTIVALHVPMMTVYAAWLLKAAGSDRWSLAAFLGFFAPAPLMLAWALALPTIAFSRRARRSIILWLAVAFGVIGLYLHSIVIGRF